MKLKTKFIILSLLIGFSLGKANDIGAVIVFSEEGNMHLPDPKENIKNSSSESATAQKEDITVRGVVIDYTTTDPLIGVIVMEQGTTNGAPTNLDGEYTIKVSSENAVLEISYLGFEKQEIKVGTRRVINVEMIQAATELGDVVVVGFGTQKKESLVSAISTIDVKELKGPTSNLTNMFAGRVAGLISYQRSGEPGQDNAQFFIRGIGSFGAGKVDPLILIDGIESSNTDLARLQPDDISDFSVLKDATAAAVYGARGANGVVLVNTKHGEDGKTRFDFRIENSISGNTENFKMADNITYMQLANQGALTRNPLAPIPYSQNKIDYTKAGANPLLYPNNDWVDLLIKPRTMNQRYNMSVSGGGRAARYYVAGTFNVDNGVLRDDKQNNFKNNVKLKNYSIRSNTTLQLTKTTEAVVRVHGQFDDYEGPIGGGGAIFSSALKANPVAFPSVYPASMSPYTSHLMFGSDLLPGNANQLYANPYADMVSGYQRYNTTTINAQLELKQNLDFVLPGLSARAMGYIKRYAHFASQRQYSPFYYKASEVDGVLNLRNFNDGGPQHVGPVGTEYLSYTPGDKKQTNSYYGEASAIYDNTFAKVHKVTGMLIGILQHSVLSSFTLANGNESLEASLPARNLGLSGRFSYMYDARYLLEFNFGYNGSERFAKNHRWGFFPSVAGGWIVSNEAFFEPLRQTFSNVKLRASYGLVGNDQIGKAEDRFFYMSNVNLFSDEGRSYFGYDYNYGRPGVSVSRYANELIGWEKSKQANFGLDVTAFDFTLTVDAYTQHRSNILMKRSYVPSTMGLQADMSANVGKGKSSGVDLALNYNKNFRNGIWTQLRANLTYATNETTVYDEPEYPNNEYYRSHVGVNMTKKFGYIAERLFVDEEEVRNSPIQSFGSANGEQAKYGAGDIKYRDMNGDGVINTADMVPIGLPTTPEIIYGFGGTVGYKDFDFSAFFQGSARSSLFIEPKKITPFALQRVNEDDDNSAFNGLQNGLLQVIADDHWSESNRNLYAFWPRLGSVPNDNNNQISTWWMRNGAFLRLKSLEAGYNVSENFTRKIGVSNVRVYLSATNLFIISGFKMWDPEMGGNGLGYPIQRVYNIGLSLKI